MPKHSYLNTLASRAQSYTPTLVPPRAIPTFGTIDREDARLAQATSSPTFEPPKSIHSVEVRPKKSVDSDSSSPTAKSKSIPNSRPDEPHVVAPNLEVPHHRGPQPLPPRPADTSTSPLTPATPPFAASRIPHIHETPAPATPTESRARLDPMRTIDDALRVAFQWVSEPAAEPRNARAPQQANVGATPNLHHEDAAQVRPMEPLQPPSSNTRSVPERSKPLPPRTIHIGRIEVNVAPAPASAVPAPTMRRDERHSNENRSAGAPESILRGLVSPIGLRQS